MTDNESTQSPATEPKAPMPMPIRPAVTAAGPKAPPEAPDIDAMPQEERVRTCIANMKALLTFYKCQLIPVVTVRGSQITSDVHITPISAQGTPRG